VTGISGSVLWQPLIPVQIIGITASVLVAALFGLREKRRIARAAQYGTTPYEQDSLLELYDEADNEHGTEKPQRFLINISLILLAILSLALGWLAAPYIFMLALSAALIVNYPKPKDQVAVINHHAPQALSMAAIILSAGVFLGIMDKGG
ncbi:hypothetical protein K6U71_16790, partial [Vibrio alginolyticus]|nr:hypothetical protein [Vibrio alginolyticus]